MKQTAFFFVKALKITHSRFSYLPSSIRHYSVLNYSVIILCYDNLIFKACYVIETYYFLCGKNVFMKKTTYLVVNHRITPQNKNLTFFKLVKNKLYHQLKTISILTNIFIVDFFPP